MMIRATDEASEPYSNETDKNVEQRKYTRMSKRNTKEYNCEQKRGEDVLVGCEFY